MVGRLACAALLVPLGCSAGAFACEDDTQCGATGQCELEGWCSFPDDGCPSGRRFGAHSGEGLGGECVPGRDTLGTETTDPSTSAGPSTTLDPTIDASSSAETTMAVLDESTTSTGAETLVTDPGSSSTGPSGDPSLLLWLDFDDAASPWADRSIDGHDVTCEARACPELDVGVVGNAARFDGIDDDLWIGDALAMPGAFTLALWIAVDVLPVEDWQDVLTRAYLGTTQNSWGIGFPPDAEVVRFVVHDGAMQLAVGQAPWPEDGGWHHVAGTWDGTTAQFYFDGLLVSKLEVAAIAYDDHPVTLGADFEFEELVNFFGGTVDDVRIYARALTDEELADLAGS